MEAVDMKVMELATPGGIPLMGTLVPEASPVLAARLIPALRQHVQLPPEVSFRFRELTTQERTQVLAMQNA
jgi:hypothetical protein